MNPVWSRQVPELFSTAAWQLEFQLSTSQSPILQEHTKVPQELEVLPKPYTYTVHLNLNPTPKV